MAKTTHKTADANALENPVIQADVNLNLNPDPVVAPPVLPNEPVPAFKKQHIPLSIKVTMLIHIFMCRFGALTRDMALPVAALVAIAAIGYIAYGQYQKSIAPAPIAAVVIQDPATLTGGTWYKRCAISWWGKSPTIAYDISSQRAVKRWADGTIANLTRNPKGEAVWELVINTPATPKKG